MKKQILFFFAIILFFIPNVVFAQSFPGTLLLDKKVRDDRRKQETENMQKEFQWWPTDAQPQPVKDQQMGGFWWWPKAPGTAKPWGNRGYIYFYKIIYDYKAEEEQPAPAPVQEVKEETPSPAPEPVLKPSLLIKKILYRQKSIWY